jgi:hypothetical protein
VKRDWIAVGAFLVAGFGGLAACGGSDDVSKNPEPKAAVAPDLQKGWEIIDAPSGYGSVATVCFGGVRVFIGHDDTYASSSVSVITDPTCQEAPK